MYQYKSNTCSIQSSICFKLNFASIFESYIFSLDSAIFNQSKSKAGNPLPPVKVTPVEATKLNELSILLRSELIKSSTVNALYATALYNVSESLVEDGSFTQSFW